MRFHRHQTSHVEWVGGSLWNIIQPAFMFMVGVALSFSIAYRQARGQTFGPANLIKAFLLRLRLHAGDALLNPGRDMLIVVRSRYWCSRHLPSPRQAQNRQGGP